MKKDLESVSHTSGTDDQPTQILLAARASSIPQPNPIGTSLSMLTVEDVAILMKTHKRTVHRWLGEGKLSSYKIGHLVRISQSDLTRFLQNYRIKARRAHPS